MEITSLDQLDYLQERDATGALRLYYGGNCEKCGNYFKKRKHGIRILLKRSGFWDVACVECSHRKSGKYNSNWKGGKHFDRGRAYVAVPHKDLCEPMMRSNRVVAEHRYVMAHHLGRCLESYEVVHHKNHDPLDNRIENLELVSYQENSSESLMKVEIKKLKLKVVELENRVKELENKND